MSYLVDPDEPSHEIWLVVAHIGEWEGHPYIVQFCRDEGVAEMLVEQLRDEQKAFEDGFADWLVANPIPGYSDDDACRLWCDLQRAWVKDFGQTMKYPRGACSTHGDEPEHVRFYVEKVCDTACRCFNYADCDQCATHHPLVQA